MIMGLANWPLVLTKQSDLAHERWECRGVGGWGRSGEGGVAAEVRVKLPNQGFLAQISSPGEGKIIPKLKHSPREHEGGSESR